MRAVLIASSLLVLAACATFDPAKSPLHPTTTIDAARFYTGTWYEIGRHPMSLTDGCVAGGTTYTAQGGDKVAVLDFCHEDTPTGELKTIGGPGEIVDPGQNAKLHVRYHFFGIFTAPRDYWVLARADDYSWFISADPSFENLWIYTRSSHPSKSEVTALVARAKALGYDTSKLEFPALLSVVD